MSSRPNFLLIITDQQRAKDLGCAGHPVLRTPNIDSLAMRGHRFNRCYVTTPVCMPNRASLMTGRTPSVHGVRHNGIPLSRNAITFVELLHAAGYRTALVGKSHLQTQTGRPPKAESEPAPEGYFEPPPELREARKNTYTDGLYDEELPSRWKEPDAHVDLPFYGFEHVDLCKGHGDRIDGNYLQWLRRHHPDPSRIMGPDNALPGNIYSVPQAWRTAVPEHLYSTAYISERVENYLRRTVDDKKPFFLMASFPDPHHPFTPPGKYWDMYSPGDMPVPDAFLSNDWRPPPHVSSLIEAYERGDPVTDNIMAHGVGLKEALEARALTCGSISCIDDAVGRILGALIAQDLAKNTIVIFTSDHGEHLGDHKLLLKGLAHYDELIRVPCIWADPICTTGAKTTQALVSTIDISATILDRAHVHPFNGFQGKSFQEVINGKSTEHRKSVLIEDENQRTIAGLGAQPRERTLVTDRWRISLFCGLDWGELYDLENDPKELNNLWESEAHRSDRASLIEQLAQELMKADDRSPRPLHQA